ncbi:SRPBCC family protein [bacterium]|nr:SRPBCC family protein [bacterium]
MPGAQRSIEIQATPAACYKVITDFENYPEFLKDVKGTRVIEKDAKNERYVVEFKISVIRDITYVLELVGEKGKSLTWTLMSASGLMKRNDGGWKLEKLGNGVTKATYSADLDLGLLVPKGVVNGIIEKSFPSMLNQFKQRIEGAR